MHGLRLDLAGAGCQPLGLGHDLLHMADHVEGDLGQVVVLASQDLGEALDGLLHRHKLTLLAGEHLGDLGIR